jgi:predicted dehydrogenase
VAVDGDLNVPEAPPRVDDRMELTGTNGVITLENMNLTLRRSGEPPRALGYDTDEAYQCAYDDAIAHFVQAILEGIPFETPPEVHLRVLRMVEEAYAVAS